MASGPTPLTSSGESSSGSPLTAMATFGRFAHHPQEAVTRPSNRRLTRIKESNLSTGWAIMEEDDDDDEEQQADSHYGKHPEKQKTKSDRHYCKSHGKLLDTRTYVCADSDKDEFLPKSPTSPPHSHPALRDVRHWIPSTSRHVVITPEMLREQSDLATPYNPNPFDNNADVNERKMDGDRLSSKDGKATARTIGTPVGRRRTTLAKIRHSILNRGYIPLVLRLISLIFSILAVMLAAFITRNSLEGGVETRPSTVMAFVVNGIAIFYLPWAARVLPSFGSDVKLTFAG